MLNKVIFEGIVTNTWKFGGDIFARLACYRDPAHPAKKLDESRDAPDYVNVRWPNAAQQMVEFPRGTHLRVEGFFQSREYTETLAEFLRKAGKERPTGVEFTGPDARKITIGRNTVEIVVGEHTIITMPQAQPARPQTVRKPALAAKPAPVATEKPAEKPAVVEAAADEAQPKAEKPARKTKAPAAEAQPASAA
jgi:hypothetical protein